MAGTEPAAVEPGRETIAGRYQIVAEIGHGGMALVYQAYDSVHERMVALKRLRDASAVRPHVAHLFEREFHTLSQLVHPRIIEVYDYQTDNVGPFYTMELLSGGDLRQRAPLGWRETCRLACDVCSALALLHSRRFAHRDLTPPNIRCTLDGRAKLFDFGSMTQFGRSKHVVGTPQFLAPEVLHGQHVDGRADLFTLGATLYFTLTGQHAFGVRSLAELPALWRQPPPAPSRFAPDVPAALDALVLELLRQAASERPASAAVVMERLSAIGGFELHEALWVEQSYLSTPLLVGRDAALAQVRARMRRASQGDGGAVFVTGIAGSGRSRFLDACALEAKLAGATVVAADRSDATGERWGVAHALFRRLQVQDAAELGLTPDWPVRQAATAEALPDGGGASRAQLQRTVNEVFVRAAQPRLLVLLVDDFDQIDEPSAALLALLATQARTTRLLLFVTSREDAEPDQPSELLRSTAEVVRLQELEADEVHQLVVSLFGDAAHTHSLAGRVHGFTHGNPLLIMRASERLVHKGLCQYAAGAWSLPSSLTPEELTDVLGEGLDASLGPSAVELLRLLALLTAERVTLADLNGLARHGDGRQLQGDVLELSKAGLISLELEHVALSGSISVRAVLQDAGEVELRELHERVAQYLERVHGRYCFSTIQHRLAAGHAAQAFDDYVTMQRSLSAQQLEDPALTFEYLQSLPADWPATMRELIAVGRRLERPRFQLLGVEFTLLGYSALTARSERELTLQVVEQLRHDSGLDLIEAMAGEAPAAELLARALNAAQQRFESLPPNRRGLPLAEAIPMLARTMIQAIGLAGRTFDAPLLSALPSLAPLSTLSPALAVVQRNLECTLELLTCRSYRARQGYLEILARLDAPDRAGLNGTHLRHMRLAVVWALGAVDANLGRASALERAAQLEADPLFEISAHRLRAFYALARGDRVTAEAERTRIELAQIQHRPPQLFEGVQALTWTVGYAALSDLLRVKQAVADIARLARADAGWQPVLHHVRGVYQTLRGDHAQALCEYERALSAMVAGQHLLYMWSTGARLWSLNRLRRFHECVEGGRAYLREFERHDMLPAAHNVLVPLAVAESALGEAQLAVAHCNAAIDALSADGASGVQLGLALHVRAELAIEARDPSAFARYADACGAQFAGADASLRARHAQLMAAGRRAGLLETRPRTESRAQAQVRSSVQAIFAEPDAAQRAGRCLELIARYSRAEGGYLYLLQQPGRRLVAQCGELPQLPGVEMRVDALLTDTLRCQEQAETMAQTTASTTQAQFYWPVPDAGRYIPLVLRHTQGRSGVVTGVAVMYVARGRSFRAPAHALTLISSALQAVGDAIGEAPA